MVVERGSSEDHHENHSAEVQVIGIYFAYSLGTASHLQGRERALPECSAQAMMHNLAKQKKFGILYGAFLCAYFSYVIFPLSYTVQMQEGVQRTSAIVHQKLVSPKNIKLFLSDLLQSLKSDEGSLGAESSSSGHVLLSKKRMLPSSQKNIVEKPVTTTAFLSELPTSPEQVAVPADDRHHVTRAVKGFHFCHSGIAPPAV